MRTLLVLIFVVTIAGECQSCSSVFKMQRRHWRLLYIFEFVPRSIEIIIVSRNWSDVLCVAKRRWFGYALQWRHISVMASEITDNSTAYSTVCSGLHRRNHVRSGPLWGDPRWILFTSQRASTVESVSTTWLRQNGRHFADDFLKLIFRMATNVFWFKF